MSKKKTVTLFAMATPVVSLLPGHVGSMEFHRAFKAEGWEGFGRITNDELQHEWWVPKKSGAWRKAEEGARGAKPVTILEW